MKIVYCLPSTYNMGGIERIISGKANMFSKIGYDVSIITTDQQRKQPYFKINDKIKCYDLGINYSHNRQRGLIKKLFFSFIILISIKNV